MAGFDTADILVQVSAGREEVVSEFGRPGR
jgi:hypothetical protein